jgi:hypothetical protein
VFRQSHSHRWPASADGGERTPVGINLAGGALTLVVVALGAGTLPASAPWWRFAALAAAVGGFAAVTLDEVALAGVVLVGWLIANGFQENRLGELSWHGSPDLWRVMVLVVSGASGLAVGEAFRQVRDWRAGTRLSRATVNLDEEGRGA